MEVTFANANLKKYAEDDAFCQRKLEATAANNIGGNTMSKKYTLTRLAVVDHPGEILDEKLQELYAQLSGSVPAQRRGGSLGYKVLTGIPLKPRY